MYHASPLWSHVCIALQTKESRPRYNEQSQIAKLQTALLEYDNSVGWLCLKRVVELQRENWNVDEAKTRLVSINQSPQFYLMILINLDLVTNRSRLATRRKSEFLRRLISSFSEYFWFSKDVLLVRWLQSRENKKSAFRHWVRDDCGQSRYHICGDSVWTRIKKKVEKWSYNYSNTYIYKRNKFVNWKDMGFSEVAFDFSFSRIFKFCKNLIRI